MQVLETVAALRAFLEGPQAQGKTLGFVPTMGALHPGHLSLLDLALRENQLALASIFVNPTQFNNPADLASYPRTLEADLRMLRERGCHAVFAPTAAEVYPEPDQRAFDFGPLAQVMEGKHRPGHFNGVAQVVSKLFDMVRPRRAYFGLKDFQQVAIVKALVRLTGQPVQVVACPTLREPDGLAMSSRNTLLSPAQRQAAPLIHQTLAAMAALRPSTSPQQAIAWACRQIGQDPELRVEYLEIVHPDTLQAVSEWPDGEPVVACAAVFAGKVRLIDNLAL